MEYVFGSSLVCRDKESARLVCEKPRLKTVTLDGDLYDPQGTVTGGSRPKGNACLLVKIAGLQAGREQLWQQRA